MKGFVPGDPRAKAAGRIGGHGSGEARLRRDAAKLARLCGLTTPGAVELIRDVRTRAYQAGWKAGRKS